MSIDIEREPELVRFQPAGRFDIGLASEYLERVRDSGAGVEVDLSAVDGIDIPALQFLLVLVESQKRRGLPVTMRDSETGVLRSLLALVGLKPERAGLSQRLNLMDSSEPDGNALGSGR